RTGGDCSRPRDSARSRVAQRCLHGSPCGLKYGQLHEARSFEPRSRTRTRYFAVPRTRATTSAARAAINVTRPLTKYDWPRIRTASLKFRATFWAIPIMSFHSGRVISIPVALWWLEAGGGWRDPPARRDGRGHRPSEQAAGRDPRRSARPGRRRPGRPGPGRPTGAYLRFNTAPTSLATGHPLRRPGS